MSGIYTNACPPKPTWSVDDIPDLSGQVMIVTGGNTGIGKETVKALLTHNAKVYIAGRSREKIESAIQELAEVTGKEAHVLQVDLADLKTIRPAVEEFQSKESELHVLFNNAGVMNPPVKLLTVDGYDLQFGTNVLGHFYFTKLLTPTLLSTAAATSSGKVRVINTSSMGHLFTSKISYDTLRDGPRRIKAGTRALYFQSKFGNILYSNELHRRYADQGIVSISLHPGNLKTELTRHESSMVARLIAVALYPAPLGALTQLYAGTTPQAAELGGQYLIPWARVGKARKETNSADAAAELWKWLEEQTEAFEAS